MIAAQVFLPVKGAGELGDFVKTHGILFSAPMIRALLNTQPDVWPAEAIDPTKPWKWQTRRKMKFQPEFKKGYADHCPHPAGSILYAKETFAFHCDVDGTACVVYRASYPNGARPALYYENGEGDFAGIGNEIVKVATIPAVWKPSIFMPKSAARLWFAVMRVRVERVNEITEADAKAEGVQADLHHAIWPYIFNYRHLWDEINGSSSFDSAPWVWVYDLKRIPKPL